MISTGCIVLLFLAHGFSAIGIRGCSMFSMGGIVSVFGPAALTPTSE
jgi:hypothetical protein